MISYAQNGEDVLLERLFRDVPAGTYIDVGANDPIDFSVTKHFYDRGWRGINIEPGPAAYARLCAARPRDRNLNVGLGEVEGVLTFHELPHRSMFSTFCAEQAAVYWETDEQVAERPVRVSTLAQVCEQYVDGAIHFLSIDVEGYEQKVLQGADWSRWRPAVVLVESTKPNTKIPSHQPWEALLLRAGYQFAYFDGLNRFYVRAESPELLEGFRAPVNICDNYVWYPYQRRIDDLHCALEVTGSRLHQTEQCLAERHISLAAIQAQLGAVQAQLTAAQGQLYQVHGDDPLGPLAIRIARMLHNSARRFPRLARAVTGVMRKTAHSVRRPGRAA
jgi:FkbM family methyltransferase